MKVRSVLDVLDKVAANWLIVCLYDKCEKPFETLEPASLREQLELLVSTKDLGASVGDFTPVLGISGVSAERLAVVGLGAQAEFGKGPAYAAGLAMGKKLSSQARKTVAVVLPRVPKDSTLDPYRVASALVSGLMVGVRGPDLRKNEPARRPFEELVVVSPTGSGVEADRLEKAVSQGKVIGEAVNLARDLANTPPSEKPPVLLAELAKTMAAEAGIEAEVWDLERIKTERFGGLLGVSYGSDEPPAFVVLKYMAGGSSQPIALVGKGVTFDSGGLSLKPTASMEDMKSDMTGAAVVLATMIAAAKLKAEQNIVGYLALTENMTGGKAMKLGDVLKMRNGKTVEVLNTDAEGRLILADALSYACEPKPSKVLNLATLTGACMVALGTKYAGLFSNNDVFASEIQEATGRAGERAWRMPMDDDFFELMKSSVADFKNVGGKYAGAITAAKFLQQFVGDTPWVHLDIAGPSWAESESGTQHAGGTGCFVRTLVEWLALS